MTDIVLVRQPKVAPISDADREVVRKWLFGVIDGLGNTHQKAWRRFFKTLLGLEPGEMVEIRVHRERLGWYHRKHFAMEQAVFEAQERFEHFEQFHLWLKVGAGYVDWIVGPKGGVVPVPKPMRYSRLDQTGMEQVHADIVAFLRTTHAQKALWPKWQPLDRDLQIRYLLEGFNE